MAERLWCCQKCQTPLECHKDETEREVWRCPTCDMLYTLMLVPVTLLEFPRLSRYLGAGGFVIVGKPDGSPQDQQTTPSS